MPPIAEQTGFSGIASAVLVEFLLSVAIDGIRNGTFRC